MIYTIVDSILLPRQECCVSVSVMQKLWSYLESRGDLERLDHLARLYYNTWSYTLNTSTPPVHLHLPALRANTGQFTGNAS